MKKSLFAMCAAVMALVAVSFTSCNKDNDEEILENYVVQVVAEVDMSTVPAEARPMIEAFIAQVNAQGTQFTDTRSGANAQFDKAVAAGADLQTAIDQMYSEYHIDIQVTIKMTCGNELVRTHTWSHK